MLKRLGLGLAALTLPACTVEITPENVLVADEAFRRTGFQALDIQDTALLPAGASIDHQWLNSELGPLALTWARRSDVQTADRLIVYCMGNMTDRQSDGSRYLAAILPFGDALIFDFPGYGDSAGPASLEAFDTALTAIAEAVDGQAYEEIIVWGHSMGGFLCPRLVPQLEARVTHVVLEATYNDASALSRFAVPWALKPFVRLQIDERFLAYNTANTLAGFDGAITVLAAGQDEELPIAAVRDLANQLEEAGLRVQYLEFGQAGHDDIPAQTQYQQRMRAALLDE